jgi:hypothetical protein
MQPAWHECRLVVGVLALETGANTIWRRMQTMSFEEDSLSQMVRGGSGLVGFNFFSPLQCGMFINVILFETFLKNIQYNFLLKFK